MVRLPKGLKALQPVANEGGVDRRGASGTREGGCDATDKRTMLCKAGMIPHIKETLRHRQRPQRGRTRWFHAAMYA
jgi:hypothetical protein